MWADKLARRPSMSNHGLPDSFILAVTAAHVYVLEDKRDGGRLVPGAVLKLGPHPVLVRVPVDQVAAEHQRRRLPRSPGHSSVAACRHEQASTHGSRSRT